MPRRPDSGRIDLAEVFRRVQSEMLAQLSVGKLFEHASTAGAATEHHWLQLFDRYLPQRYRSAPAFVIDSTGRRSRQIDIAIFDNLSHVGLRHRPRGLAAAPDSSRPSRDHVRLDRPHLRRQPPQVPPTRSGMLS